MFNKKTLTQKLEENFEYCKEHFTIGKEVWYVTYNPCYSCYYNDLEGPDDFCGKVKICESNFERLSKAYFIIQIEWTDKYDEYKCEKIKLLPSHYIDCIFLNELDAKIEYKNKLQQYLDNLLKEVSKLEIKIAEIK